MSASLLSSAVSNLLYVRNVNLSLLFWSLQSPLRPKSQPLSSPQESPVFFTAETSASSFSSHLLYVRNVSLSLILRRLQSSLRQKRTPLFLGSLQPSLRQKRQRLSSPLESPTFFTSETSASSFSYHLLYVRNVSLSLLLWSSVFFTSET